jgi:DNA primase
MHRYTIRKATKEFDLDLYVESNYEIKYAHGRNGRELRICCPMCGEQKFKCYVNVDLRAYQCFKCGFGRGKKDNGKSWDLVDFIAETEGISRPLATVKFYNMVRRTTPEVLEFSSKEKTDEQHKPKLYKTVDLPPNCVPLRSSDFPEHWAYLQERGFSERDLLATRLHVIAVKNQPLYNESGKFRGNLGNRIVFPIYVGDSELISWLARTIDADVPKYLNAPGSDLAQALWPNMPCKSGHAVIVEGLIDALAIRRLTGYEAYATFGKHVSEQQINRLKTFKVKEVTVWYDIRDAKKDMLKSAENLQLHFDSVSLPWLDRWNSSFDPGDLYKTKDAAPVNYALDHRVSVYAEGSFVKWQLIF